MKQFTTPGILDLSDELLLTIFKKLNNIDLLCSFIGVNQKLDKFVRDITFTRSLDFVTVLSNDQNDSKNNSIVDRFCIDILSQIQHNVECFTLESSLIERVLYTRHYPKLHKITLVNLQLEVASRILTDESLFIENFKHNISHLVITINDYITNDYMWELVTNVFARIFIIFTNLTHLEFDLEVNCAFSPAPFFTLPSTSCYSSSIIYLRVKVYCFDDCLYLLDGRLSQLHTFIVEVDHMRHSPMNFHKTNFVLNLKCFSLSSTKINIYDEHIVPLLRRMSQLEKLILSIIVQNRSSFIDGAHLYNDILSKMPQLQTFIFDIVTEIDTTNEKSLPSSNDIRRTFIQRGYLVDCYIDYSLYEKIGCHVYSLPYSMNRLHPITNNFPGGIFMSVVHLILYDNNRSFENNFFARLSQSFPLLKILSLQNNIKQEKKRFQQSNEYEQTSSIIKYPHLTNLYFGYVHIDYLEQFLIDSNSYLPCLQTLYIRYEDLVTVTENFTRNSTHTTCSKLKHIIFEEGSIVCSKEFHLYFLSL